MAWSLDKNRGICEEYNTSLCPHNELANEELLEMNPQQGDHSSLEILDAASNPSPQNWRSRRVESATTFGARGT